MKTIHRRTFLHGTAIAAGMTVTGISAAEKPKRSATDWVILGRSKVKVTRLGIGSGSNGGSVQRAMGQKKFTEMIRHAYDRGVRFFDTADNYDRMHEMYAEALKGIDRSTYTLQTKIKIHPEDDVRQTLDRLRRELNTDYFDHVLLHCAMTENWPKQLENMRDQLSEAKEKDILRAHGASVHGLKPLRSMPDCGEWLDVALLRVNHKGTKMDGPTGAWEEDGTPYHSEAVAGIQKVHESGAGVIGMKIIGNGNFTDPAVRDASIRYVMGLDFVDAVVIGFKSPQEVDEAIERMNKHLNA